MKKIKFLSAILILPVLFTSCFSLPDVDDLFQDVWSEDGNPILDEDDDDFVFDKEKFLEMWRESEDDSVFAEDEENQSAAEKSINNSIESIQKATESITPEMEYYIGRAVAANITEKYAVLNNKEVTAYLNKICSAIIINSPKPYLYKGYFVAVLDTDEINAMATPGGHIFVTKGLLKCADSEDAIAAILAHEISHIQLGHSIKAIKSSRITDAVLKTIVSIGSIYASEKGFEVTTEQIDSLNNTSDAIFGTLVDSGFSVVQEYNADAYAVALLSETGYDATAMVDMLTMLKKNSNAKDESSGWGKTHPKPENRIKNVTNVLKDGEIKRNKRKPVRQERFDTYMASVK